ncbi:MAG: hypothetical protein R3B06_25940 [Kofleriaceae bacterium]
MGAVLRPFQLMLLVAGQTGATATHGARRYSIGQYLLCERAAYQRAGSRMRSAARSPDLHAARVVDGGGRFRAGSRAGRARRAHVPEGVGAVAPGWRRSFRAGLAAAGGGSALEMIAVIAWLAGVPLEARAGAGGRRVDLGRPGRGGLRNDRRHAGPRPTRGGPPARVVGPGVPCRLLAFVAISMVAALDHLRGAPVRWRGRTVALPASRGGEP